MHTYIIVPYRNREKHLDLFMRDNIKKYNAIFGDNYSVIIVEQSNDNRNFNRGKLLNVGFLFANDDNGMYIFHDIDLCPLSDDACNLYKKESENIIGIYNNDNSKWGSLGGIIKMNHKNYVAMNGHPNYLWGWGGEDDVLRRRANLKNIKCDYHFIMTQKNINDHFIHHNDCNDRINNKNRFKLMRSSKIHNGLSNCEYTIIETIKISNNITIIKVQL